MQIKKQPERKCVGCGVMHPKKDLVRIVKTVISDSEEDGQQYEISLDLTGKKSGRGAYICNDPDCLAKAEKAKRIQKALACPIPDEVFKQIREEIENG